MNETDRELLEWAFKAYRPGENYIRMVNDAGYDYWNPLKDSGQALELAVKLGLSLRRDSLDVGVFLRVREMNCGELGQEMLRADPLAATRRAIVKAAAEIGKAMP